ncbi:MAG TPA: hypothetical protein VEC01_19495 [Noviherbaspirillum sp.]|uniref:hypothetical protein n=1 Tax=Noviherbaspirillum sp. TaxID=1926288 RepID=UPI002D4ABC09|nr:hypothetical protein [Noviherbaspirillum sp.]HYD97515.1 hypothetical protein [Noviherbaspirillum sp.]
MSSRNKLIAFALAAASLSADAAPANGPDDGSSNVDLRSVNSRRAADAAKGRRQEDRVRCWQYGKLIYESRVAAPAEKSAGVVEMRSGAGGSVQLMDMNHGLCIVETGRK